MQKEDLYKIGEKFNIDKKTINKARRKRKIGIIIAIVLSYLATVAFSGCVYSGQVYIGPVGRIEFSWIWNLF